MEWKKGWENKKIKNWGMLGKRGGCLGNCDKLCKEMLLRRVLRSLSNIYDRSFCKNA